MILLSLAVALALPAQPPAARIIEPMREETPGVHRERLYVKTGGGKEIRVDFRRPPPATQGRLPAIICVSPWGNTAGALRGMGTREPGVVVRAGIAVATFDYPGLEDNPSPDAVKDKYGPERQFNVRDVIRYVAARADVNPANVGVVTFSSANILAAGALTRPPGDTAVKFWIDGEGPTNRHALLLNIPGTMAAVAPFPDEEHQGEWMARQFLGSTLADEAYWKEREAFQLMKRVRCRFLRLQGEDDHVHHWYFGHAIHALNSAMAGDAPWVRGGNGPVNVWHQDSSKLAMLPGRIGAQGERLLSFIKEMTAMPPLGQAPEDGRKPARPAQRFAGGGGPSVAAPSSGLAPAPNPMLISLVIHVEEGKKVSAERYREVATGLRSLGEVFSRHNARINLDVEPGFVTAMFDAGDNLLAELEKKHRFAIGAFPHGMRSAETAQLIRKSGATPVFVFGNWGRENKDWVRDAIENKIDVMLCFFSILMPEVTPGSPFDHETVPWNRADRVHPWRVASTERFLQHDPAGEVIYIPGDSIDELEKLHERYLTGVWNRPLDKIQPTPRLDERDFEVASDYLRRQLTFADPARINTWYIAVNSKKVRNFTASAPMFERWLESVEREFVERGVARWANAAEVRAVYLEWERRGSR